MSSQHQQFFVHCNIRNTTLPYRELYKKFENPENLPSEVPSFIVEVPRSNSPDLMKKRKNPPIEVSSDTGSDTDEEMAVLLLQTPESAYELVASGIPFGKHSSGLSVYDFQTLLDK